MKSNHAKVPFAAARLLTVTTTLHQQGSNAWQFLEQAWMPINEVGGCGDCCLIPESEAQSTAA